jgi:hypothetical protein
MLLQKTPVSHTGYAGVASSVYYLAYQLNLPFSNYGIFFISGVLCQIDYCAMLKSDWRQYITPDANLTPTHGRNVSQEPHRASPVAGKSSLTFTISSLGRNTDALLHGGILLSQREADAEVEQLQSPVPNVVSHNH